MSDLFVLSAPWWHFVLRAIVIYAMVMVMIRVSGKRAVGQFTPFDLVLLILIGIHIAVVLGYWIGKNENLVGPMLHGRKAFAPMAPLRFESLQRALGIAALAGFVVWVIVMSAGIK